MSDLNNQNASEMSMGQLQSASAAITGAIADAARSLNSGKTPSYGSNTGESLVADVAASSFMGGMKSGVVQVAMSAYENGSSGQSSSSFFAGTAASKKNRNGFGHTMTYAEQKKEIKREAREISYIARTGRAPKPRDHDSVLRKSNGIFEQANVASMSIGPGGYMPKCMQLTPAMMINLGLVPSAIKSNLDAVNKRIGMPDTQQIVAGLNRSEQSGEDLFNKASDSVKEVVANAMPASVSSEKDKQGQSKGAKLGAPKAPMAPPSPNDMSKMNS